MPLTTAFCVQTVVYQYCVVHHQSV